MQKCSLSVSQKTRLLSLALLVSAGFVEAANAAVSAPTSTPAHDSTSAVVVPVMTAPEAMVAAASSRHGSVRHDKAYYVAKLDKLQKDVLEQDKNAQPENKAFCDLQEQSAKRWLDAINAYTDPETRVNRSYDIVKNRLQAAESAAKSKNGIEGDIKRQEEKLAKLMENAGSFKGDNQIAFKAMLDDATAFIAFNKSNKGHVMAGKISDETNQILRKAKSFSGRLTHHAKAHDVKVHEDVKVQGAPVSAAVPTTIPTETTTVAVDAAAGTTTVTVAPVK
ncbi:MAG: hypothetical protein NTX76_04140 [Alphaproteobacteria bacterium]|nr:hypothetical protein [Alphaproteobacteria bacterium]